MKSISALYRQYGTASEVVEATESDVPVPQKGQALVKLLRAVINPSDLGMIGGTYGRLRALPAVGGREGIGEVVQTGDDVECVKVGDRVRIPADPGVWTQYQVYDADDLFAVPSDIDLNMCAMSFVNPPTAFRVLNDFADLKEGDWVIQNGAGSAVGYFMVQLCKARGIKTVNILRNAAARRDALTSIGADIVVDEAEFDAKEIKDATGGKLRLGLNQIGGESVFNMIKAVGNSATIVTIGAMTGEPTRFPTRFFIFNDLRLRGFWWDNWQRTHPRADSQKLFAEIFDLERKGILKAPVDSVFEMPQIKSALERAEQKRRNGKVLLSF